TLTGVQPDSRRVRTGDLYVAIEGFEGDAHRFITDALRKGASAIVAGHPVGLNVKVPVAVVPDPRAALSRLARELFQAPDEKLRLTGVTGTNGKTSVVGYVYQLLQQHGRACGQLGTVCYRFENREIPARRTTPGAPDLHEYLHAMVEAGCEECVMEVSSHALDQKRVDGLQFDTAVFTNLTQDHLDYHPDMETYFQAKATLFRMPSVKTRIAGDDPWSRRLARECGEPVWLCGLAEDCTVRGELIESSVEGLRARIFSPWGEGLLHMQAPGEHNLRNMLQALAVCADSGIPLENLLSYTPQVISAPGRLQPVPSPRGKIFVDYAHTPDALDHVVGLLKGLARGKLVVLFGCGGDRDRSKRPLMVQAAAAADEMILTQDNPRTEDPEQIFADMKTGLRDGDVYRIIEDRRLAIEYAVSRLGTGDILLLAGKGHETVQLVGALQLPFDDRQVAAEMVAKLELSRTGSC
ncbi:MAG: UDP-N-acetylmuramoyl-L-alanyl-D-glutamate--2,6-diaminopimelate ligase, partial [Kiritimatiellia bacterium]